MLFRPLSGSAIRHKVLIFVIALASIASVRIASAASFEANDRDACRSRGGFVGIDSTLAYMPFFLQYPVANNGSSPCPTNCPQCVQYCYEHTIVCADGARLEIYTQLRPFVTPYGDHPTYSSEADQSREWAEVQEVEGLARRRLAAAIDNWRPLSPIAEAVIFGCFIAVSTIAWFGRNKHGTNLNDWGLNVPFNLYFALSLSTFNTAMDSSSFAQLLDKYVFFHSWLFFLAVLAFCGINAIPLARGWDYLFVKHRAAEIVSAAVETGAPINVRSFARALWISPQDIFEWRPRWYYIHQAEKAQKLKETLDRDTELARAVIARERAHAELQDEQQARQVQIRKEKAERDAEKARAAAARKREVFKRVEERQASAEELRERVLRGGTLK